MPVSQARRIAFQILLRVEAEGAYASDLLHAELPPAIPRADAALATEISLGVLRWRGLLDFFLERYTRKPSARAPKLDLPVAVALRMGLYQLRFLRRVPARAAVSESVELVKYARKSSAASLVNAVLRRAAAEAAQPPESFLPANLSEPARLAILHSHPAWLIERWLARFGRSRTLALLAADNRPPRLSCALRDPARAKEIAAELREANFQVESGALLKSALAVSGGRISSSAAFRRGDLSIQDEASQAVPLLLRVCPGDRVLDLCAAPGGKTAPLARATGPSGMVVAADRHAHRLAAMRAQFERLALGDVRSVELDAEAALPFGALFHRILVDAPCSGTGTLARHPEIRWRLTSSPDPTLNQPRLASLHALQARILANALAALAPGGLLVYSTCSLESEENEDVLAAVLPSFPQMRLAPAAEAAQVLAPHLAPSVTPARLIDAAGYFRTLPGELPVDGFFAALIHRAA